MEDFSEQQLFFMRRAIALGEMGKISAPPNPWVGCVIVKHGKIIGEGYHKEKGGPHAESEAIRSSTVSVKGSDMYVTLEPCCHYGSTPPCVDLLIQYGIKHVYVALMDPDPRVSGKGIAALRKAGILVYEGLGKEDAELSLKPYLHQRCYASPWIVIKSASTVDGQVADSSGKSQWITCSEARNDVGKLRAASQAIIVGAQTVIQDNPRLTARTDSGELYFRQPTRIVLDSLGRISPQARMFHTSENALYVTTTLCPEKHVNSFRDRDIEVLVTQPQNLRVNLFELRQYLSNKNILQVVVEGGPVLQTAFIKANLAHAIILYIGGKILGDQRKTIFGDLGLQLDSSKQLLLKSSKIIGNSLRTLWEFV
ncbi:bifunctional diaminohydroxyphosphoribosylaminopyrimidine deaminase/5-amino-6-(5-phosphoribosylamino)uracil reductase RibD [Chlamydia avium]|uniref:Riboflavin biosynthesis protein RibD n=1 Tax=Chlamydia avium 10DC88 TaxID=1229831 RepID=W8JRQ5_9CHLA|nr:bifunctional diaminohydroxyphosphoribosylaminopyrimidine deaminase/5-amino-6-(5-phosphoribosylamino)uracil reductase RibD [Chlamydia avium]AHK63528.1 Riboflavin biosynthesis protein RibD [Chlamydia avium 10DC88]